MLPEIALNILDIAENSTRAGANLVTIRVIADPEADKLTVEIIDDGCGMNEEQVQRVTDPFFTTRTTRKVGLGVPFFKQEAELTGGSFSLKSEVGVGTDVTAVFGFSSVDRMPLGDIDATIMSLLCSHQDINFLYEYAYGDKSFTLDTREMREIIGDVPFETPEVYQFLKDYLKTNREETDGGVEY